MMFTITMNLEGGNLAGPYEILGTAETVDDAKALGEAKARELGIEEGSHTAVMIGQGGDLPRLGYSHGWQGMGFQPTVLLGA